MGLEGLYVYIYIVLTSTLYMIGMWLELALHKEANHCMSFA